MDAQSARIAPEFSLIARNRVNDADCRNHGMRIQLRQRGGNG